MDEMNIILQDEMRHHIDSIRKWYKFFGVLSIVMASLVMAFSVLTFVFNGFLSDLFTRHIPGFWIVNGVLFALSSAVMVPLAVFLLRAARSGKKAVALNNEEAKVAFMRHTKLYWKYFGIVSIVALGVSVLMIAFDLVAIFTFASDFFKN